MFSQYRRPDEESVSCSKQDISKLTVHSGTAVLTWLLLAIWISAQPMGCRNVQRRYLHQRPESCRLRPRRIYLWDATGQAQGLKAQGYIGPVDSAVTVVNSDDETAVGLDAVVSPLKNLALKAALAANFEDDTDEMQKAIKLDGAMQVTDKTLVNAGFRTVDADFDPVYRSHAKDQWGNPINPVDLYKGQTGFNVGVQTEVKDVNLAASYDQPTALGKIGANTDIGGFRLAAGTELNVNGVTEISLRKTTASVEKDFAGEKTAVTGRYEVAVEPAKAVKSKVSANAKTNLIESLPNLGLGASVEFDNFGENPVAEVKADYTAPNGLTIKGGYNTAKGAVAEAGVRVNF